MTPRMVTLRKLSLLSGVIGPGIGLIVAFGSMSKVNCSPIRTVLSSATPLAGTALTSGSPS